MIKVKIQQDAHVLMVLFKYSGQKPPMKNYSNLNNFALYSSQGEIMENVL